MGKISVKKVISDVADKYIEASGDEEAVKYGNIAQKVYDAISSGGGIKDGYTVKFLVDDEDYYIASCDFVTNTITEPPVPEKEGYAFEGWQTVDEEPIEFPYSPVDYEETLYAKFVTVIKEIEVVTAGTALYTYSGGAITKKYDNTDSNFTLFGYCTHDNDTQKFLFLVSKIAGNTRMSGNEMSLATEKAFTYNGETWYYSHSNATATTSIDHACAELGDLQADFSGNPAAVAAGILDYYFGV